MLSMRTIESSISIRELGVTSATSDELTLVPHAIEMTVAAITEMIRVRCRAASEGAILD
jgi:hypothetical protein